MVVSPAQRTLGKVAATLGMVQGFAWFALSLTCIVVHNMSHKLDMASSFSEYLNKLLYMLYLKDFPNDSNFIIRPRDFTILMWFYLFLSSGWFAGSMDQYVACCNNKKRQSTMMIVWGVLTLVISLIDLVFTCLLVRDYTHCGEILKGYEAAAPCYLAVGIVMTLAARGYTLWVLNVVFAHIMLWNAWKIIKDDHTRGENYNCSIPRAKLPASSPFNTLEHSNFNAPINGINREMGPSASPKNYQSSPNRGNRFIY